MQALIPFILGCLKHLKQIGLAISSIKVHLAAISTFHPGTFACSIFAGPMVSCFLKGLDRLYPPVRNLIPAWDLNLVLTRLMGSPFEPLASCSFLYLSWKIATRNAITSARRVSELKALTSDPRIRFFTSPKYSYDHIQPSYRKWCPSFI